MNITMGDNPTPSSAENLHQAMMDSIERTSMPGINGYIPKFNRDQLNIDNALVIKNFGLATRKLLIYGPDALTSENQTSVYLHRPYLGELLGALILKRQLAPIEEYFEEKLFSDLDDASRQSAVDLSVRWLDQFLVDRNSDPLVTVEAGQIGLVDVTIKDMRHLKAYHQARYNQGLGLFKKYIFAGGQIPLLDEKASQLAAWEAHNLLANIGLDEAAYNRRLHLRNLLYEIQTEGFPNLRNVKLKNNAKLQKSALNSLTDKLHPDWQQNAACRGTQTKPGGNDFFAKPGEHPAKKRNREARAKNLCAHCVVIPECREYSKKEKFGIWAGESKDN
ncbi:MAG: WhiB family transcriptional regulator [Candidatus Saccharibacteria bacterium]